MGRRNPRNQLAETRVIMAAMPILKIGTRSSPLSVVQTKEVTSELMRQFPHVTFSFHQISTVGDENKDAPMLSMERGMFVKNIERALLAGDIDLAVHSAKDLTSDSPVGLKIAAVPKRKDPRDALVNRWNLPLAEMPKGARIGTSSPRRTALLLGTRPDICVIPIRGNVETRLTKIGLDNYDGVILAAAGLSRLGRLAAISEYLPLQEFTPESGQGCLAIQVRSNDTNMMNLLSGINHGPSLDALRTERAFLREFGGGCTIPVAAHAQLVQENRLKISSVAALPDGSRIFRSIFEGDLDNPEKSGKMAAQHLLDAGAQEIIEKI